MMTSVLLLSLLAIDGSIQTVDGVIMMIVFSIGSYVIVRNAAVVKIPVEVRKEYRAGLKLEGPSMLVAVFTLLVGIALLLLGAQATVTSASDLAQQAGLSQFLIGLTIVSIGTTLPEMVVSIVAARKKETDLVIGNAIGSVSFNSLVVVSATSMFGGVGAPSYLLFAGFLPLIIFSTLLLIIIWKRAPFSRREGCLMISLYCAYIGFIAVLIA